MRRQVGYAASVEDHGAVVLRIGAGDDVDESRLAGPVLTEQHVDLAAPDVEVHAVKSDDTGEALGDADHGEQGLVLPGRATRIV